jgi:glucose-6-phosphate isomerase
LKTCRNRCHPDVLLLLLSCCLQKLMDLARAANLKEKIDAMYAGDHINSTEDRAVLHVATRARREQVRLAAAAGAVR